MGNWRSSFPSNYLKASDFEKPKLLTIKKFVEEDIGGEPKPIVYFEEDQKGLVLNKVNGDSIEKISGSWETENWKGHRIVLFQSETDYQGKRVPCIRVRAPKPGAQLPPPPPPPEFDATDDDVPF